MDAVDDHVRQNELMLHEIKSSVQNASEFLARQLVRLTDALILWLGLIVMIALASAELWIGVGGVALVVGWVWFRGRLIVKSQHRLDRFRERFRELVEKTSASEMLDEDKQFLQQRADTILFPIAVAEHKRARLSPTDLPHVEALYQEFGHEGLRLHHWAFQDQKHAASCELCTSAMRVKHHVEEVCSRIGAPIECKDSLQVLRRIMGRRNSEVVFLELDEVFSPSLEKEQSEAKRKLKQELEGLKNRGFDIDMLYKELCAAKKRMAKERTETKKVFARELVNAQFFDLGEEYIRQRRYQEWKKMRWEAVAHILADIG